MTTKKTGPGGVALEPQTTGFIMTGGTTTQNVLTVDVTATVSALAPLSSPTFTNVPAAPTASPGTNTTQVATTAFVAAAVGAITSGNLVTAAETADFTAAVNTNYAVTKSGSACVATLPTTAALGDVIGFQSLSSYTVQVTAGAGQTIIAPGLTTKTAGYVEIAATSGTLLVRCTTANTTWTVVDGTGAFTVQTS